MIVPTVEIMPSYRRHKITHALFDFDGTLSLIRDGWTEIMVQLFIDETKTPLGGTTEDWNRKAFLEEIENLTGRQTIIQMKSLVDRVLELGMTPKDPEEYKAEFLRRLEVHIAGRVAGLDNFTIDPTSFRVKGVFDFLRALYREQIPCDVFSGTDERYVNRDMALLRIRSCFQKIYGATPDLQASSKKAVIQKVLNENRITGDNLVVFGDGMVEIQEAKSVGALAVGVASREGHNGERDEVKRNRLVEAGADLIIADYQKFDLWMPLVLGE